MARRKFGIDGGHGPNTPGKRSPDGTLREFHFNHPVAQEVGLLLESRYDCDVVYLYDSSGHYDTPLRDRTDKAIREKVDAVISIHANASGSAWSSARGIETFVYDGAKRTATSQQLAENVQDALLMITNQNDRGVKRGNLHMVREPNNVGIDAILVECGFMTNVDDLALLKSNVYRSKCALGIVQGIALTYDLTPKVQISAVGGDDMSLFKPQSSALSEAVSRVLLRMQNKADNPIAPLWREKLAQGTLTNSQAIGLLYVFIDRGLIGAATAPQKGIGLLEIKTSDYNMREKADLGAPIVRKLQPGEVYFVYEVSGDWYNLGGGWVSNPGQQYATFVPH